MNQKTKQRKKRTKRNYFGPEVDVAIVEYNSCTDPVRREQLYNQTIKPAFDKLAEFIIHTFKFYHFGDQTLLQAQQEVVSFLIEKLHRFNPNSGKAFSYFSIVAKHYCIHKNRINYKKLTSHDKLDVVGDQGFVDDVSVKEKRESIKDFQDMFVDYWNKNIEKSFSKESERTIAYAIVELFTRREYIEIFNKKALYIYLRELSGHPTNQITKMIKVFSQKYASMYNDFLEYGCLVQGKVY